MDLFPYAQVRDVQSDLLLAVSNAVANGTNLIAHAPTGLGKTAASLAAAISNSIKTDRTIFFVTSMHTQHKIAIDTVRDIRKKHGVKIISVDIIGKKHLCLQPGVASMQPRDFTEYCRAMREDSKCDYYSNLKKGESLSFAAQTTISKLKAESPVSTGDLLEESEKNQVCPYEISMMLGKESKVIVTDYYYMFHPKIRDSFLKKTEKELTDAIIIVDEAHNLPSRIKDLASEKLTSITVKRAISEAEHFNREDISKILRHILTILEGYAGFPEEERYVSMTDFKLQIDDKYGYQDVIDGLAEAADIIWEEQKQSYIGSVAIFLEAWPGTDEGFTRIFSKVKGARDDFFMLSYKCLDPGVISRPIIKEAHSTILMSGTLTPTYMYREVLGFEQSNTKEMTLDSPFPEENRLTIVVPRTSTKYATRSEGQYKEMARIISGIVNSIPGNSAVFFPSFRMRDDVNAYMQGCEKTVFLERQGLQKHEKEELLENYKAYKDSGAVLLGCTTGSFSEGIDLPGDYLKGVVVVGLPLQKPDLETKALIDYYDKKFGKGWEYGYTFPAFNKTLQSAGRCIRSGTDRGVMVFLDERYSWPNYIKCFPEHWNLKITLMYESMIKDFFQEKN